jgi:hypothetical protein
MGTDREEGGEEAGEEHELRAEPDHHSDGEKLRTPLLGMRLGYGALERGRVSHVIFLSRRDRP